MTYKNLKMKTNSNLLIKPRPSKFIKKFLSIIEYYSKWYKKIEFTVRCLNRKSKYLMGVWSG
jgi:hypothetical protein